MSFINLCHTAETVEVPLRRSHSQITTTLMNSSYQRIGNWRILAMWQASSLKPGLCCAAAAAGLRIQDCRETQEAPAQDQYAINALKFPPYPRGTKAVQFRTAKSLISGCTEGHWLPVSEIWDSWVLTGLLATATCCCLNTHTLVHTPPYE